jgi:hypothetical protein
MSEEIRSNIRKIRYLSNSVTFWVWHSCDLKAGVG